MNDEAVVENTPVETTEVNDEDFFDSVNQEVINENLGDDSEEESEETNNEESNDESEEESTKEESEQSDDTQNQEAKDYSELLKDLSSKVKYNGENVEVKSEDELITNYQKGLNYDKLMEKYNSLEKSKASLENSKAMTYITEKAKELGYSVDEYMDQVEAYEKQQQREQEQARLEEMINNGVPEDVAKEVIATSQLRKDLQVEKNKIEEEKAKIKAEQDKNKDYEDFINAYPEVKAEDIPKEVFENSVKSKISLRQAYTEWRVKELEQELKTAKQNESNRSRSVGSTQEQGVKENIHVDPFLEGFDE